MPGWSPKEYPYGHQKNEDYAYDTEVARRLDEQAARPILDPARGWPFPAILKTS